MSEIIDTSEAKNMVLLTPAKEMTKRWQELINPETGKHYTKSYRFDKVDFTQVLSNEEVEYVRLYPAIKHNGEVTLLVVGVNAEGNDIIKSDILDSGIYDFSFPCPKTCGESPLLHIEIPSE